MLRQQRLGRTRWLVLSRMRASIFVLIGLLGSNGPVAVQGMLDDVTYSRHGPGLALFPGWRHDELIIGRALDAANFVHDSRVSLLGRRTSRLLRVGILWARSGCMPGLVAYPARAILRINCAFGALCCGVSSAATIGALQRIVELPRCRRFALGWLTSETGSLGRLSVREGSQYLLP